MRDKVKNIIGLLLLCAGVLLAICAGVRACCDMILMRHTSLLCKGLLGAGLFSFAAGLLLLAGSDNPSGGT